MSGGCSSLHLALARSHTQPPGLPGRDVGMTDSGVMSLRPPRTTSPRGAPATCLPPQPGGNSAAKYSHRIKAGAAPNTKVKRGPRQPQ